MQKFNSSAIVCAVILAVGIFLLGVEVNSGLGSISANQRTVTVRGLCEKEVTANKVTWPIVSKSVGNDLPSIYSAIEGTNKAIL